VGAALSLENWTIDERNFHSDALIQKWFRALQSGFHSFSLHSSRHQIRDNPRVKVISIV
jgi:hypothetical protein